MPALRSAGILPAGSGSILLPVFRLSPTPKNPPWNHRVDTRRTRRERAFTLIEVMMAMAIFGLLIVAIYSSWTLILKSTQIGQEASARVQRERIAMRYIKEALAGVISFQADPYNYAFLAENNNNGSLSFAARLPESFPRSSRPAWDGFDVRRVSFSIEAGADYSQRQLVLRQNPLLKDMHPDERDYPFVVSKEVNKMEFEFWDQKKRDWVNDWTRTNELPKMIKIKMEFLRRNPKDPYGQAQKVEIVDIAPLPAIMVPAMYQGPPGGQPPGGTPPPP